MDIEGGSSTGYAAFVTEIRSLAAGASKRYYVTGAPQCVYPDAYLGSVINAVGFDAIYVQFYNNQCGLNNYATISDWNYGVWDVWAKTISPNPNVKVFLAAPAASLAAGSGYVSLSTLASIATTTRNSFSSFGGVALWDESQAWVNSRYDLGIKQALQAAGGTGFTYPACSAAAFVSGNDYTAGEQVSYDGYIWEAAYWVSSTPSINGNTGWAVISACGGTSTGGGSTTTSSHSTTTTATTTTTTTTTVSHSSTTTTTTTTSTSASSTPSGGTVSCSGVSAWVSTTAYTGGEQVTYGGSLWTAKWWTEADTPGGSAGDWTDDGVCAAGTRRRSSRLWRS